MITIIDYGLGNIKAFQHIYNHLNVKCDIACDAEKLGNATKIILPGVGSFDYAMSSLNKSGMREVLDNLVLTRNTPILGICVGMQMLANSSEEGSLDGLGYVDGSVKKFSREQLVDYPLPHMGWHLDVYKLIKSISKHLKKFVPLVNEHLDIIHEIHNQTFRC